MSTDRIRLILGLAIVLAVLASATLPAADQKADENDDTPKTEAKDEPKEEAVDRYKVPEGGVAELEKFIDELTSYRPKTREEFAEFREKRTPAIRAAGDKLQEIATDEEKKEKAFKDAIGAVLFVRASESRLATAGEKQELLDAIKAAITAPEPSQHAISAARQLAVGAEYGARAGGTPEAAVPIYSEFGSILAKSSDEATAHTGQSMLGAARRLELLGKPLEISGTLMDGKPFDWAQYRGKVVLVDFWATWCGPCIGELPNVKANYEKYHDLGFEVVGISLDQDRQRLEEFLEKEKNPWVTLHDGDWSKNALATYYGIMGIPTVLLVDKEGKVVSLRARGPELGKQLAALLGPAEDSDSAEETKTDDKPKADDK